MTGDDSVVILTCLPGFATVPLHGLMIDTPVRETLVVTRSYTFEETQVLAKASEEEVLRRALADDLARRVVRRIEGLGSAPTAPNAPEPAGAGPAQPGA